MEETPADKNEKKDKKEESKFKKRMIEEEKVVDTDEGLEDEVKQMLEDDIKESKQENASEAIEESKSAGREEKSQKVEPGISTMQSDLKETSKNKKTHKRNRKQIKLATCKNYRSPYMEDIKFPESAAPKSQRSQRKVKHKKVKATPRTADI